MADTSNLTNFLTDVAKAIKDKKGTTEKIPAANFDTEITSIETGIDTTSANPITPEDVSLNKEGFVNGEKIIGKLNETKSYIGFVANPDDIEDGFDKLGNPTLDIHRNSSTYDYLIRKTADVYMITPKSAIATHESLTPEKLVKGNTVLGIEGTAEGQTINNQNKTITENGTYQADEGYTGLGTVTVNVSNTGDVSVKLFNTIEEMNADTTAKEKDLALVYKNLESDLVIGETYTSLYLPKTIIFDTAIASTKTIILDVGDVRTVPSVRVTKTAINFCEPGGFVPMPVRSVSYESTDGITYTRTDSLAEGLTISEIYSERYNSITIQETDFEILRQMFKVREVIFDGLFQYTDGTYGIAPSQLTLQNPNELLPNKVAYGQNGIVKGDGSIYNNLEHDKLVNVILGDSSLLNNINVFKGELFPSSNPDKNMLQRVVRSDNNDFMIYGNIKCESEYVSFSSAGTVVDNNILYVIKPGTDTSTMYKIDFNNFKIETIVLNNVPSNLSIYSGATYINKSTKDIYLIMYNTDSGNKIIKISNGIASVLSDFFEWSNQSKVFQILGYDDIENALYTSVSGWSQNTHTKAIYKVTDGNCVSVKSLPSYTYAYSNAWETENYLGLSLGIQNGSNKIYYKKKGDSAWKELDLSSYSDRLGEAPGAYEISETDITLSLGSKGNLHFNPITNILITVSEDSGSPINYKDIMSKTDKFLYTKDSKYDLNGVLIEKIINNSDSYCRLDSYPMYVLDNSPNLRISELFPVKLLTENINTTNSVLCIRNEKQGRWKQLNDFNYDLLRDLNVMSQEEYNIALNTANQIKGGNV